MSGDIGMGTRIQHSPFRETAWDHKLDKMLDDLKTTVSPDEMRTSQRTENSLTSSYSQQLPEKIETRFVDIFRNTSRSDSRSSNRQLVEDDGLMKHYHKEYVSPDKGTKIVTDKYEYNSGDPNKFQKKVMKSTYSSYKVSGDISSDLDALRHGPSEAVMDAARSTTVDTQGYNSRHLHNGKFGANDDDVEYIINDGTGGEVRDIVWRNRFEKTYEAHDSSSNIPSMSIEADARRQRHKENMAKATDISRLNPPIPPISPGGQSWADPIPLPTPPQVSPRGEPGVAYVYTYGQSGGTPVQHLPPLNYVQVPTGDGSTTPGSGNQPVIYHYSYHYTLQPGQTLPDGAMKINPSDGPHPHLQPALQVAPPISMKPAETIVNKGPVTDFAYRTEQSKSTRVITNENDRTLSNILLHTRHQSPSRENIPPPNLDRPRSGSMPRSGSVPRSNYSAPRSPEITRRNVNISINKYSTHTTTDTSNNSSTDHKCSSPHGPPFASTPFINRERERSLSPDRYPGQHRDPHLYYCKTAADSLDRLRKPHNDPLPFPDTSPITSTGEAKIPRKIDDLMTSFSDSEDGRGTHHLYHLRDRQTSHDTEVVPLIKNNNQTDIELNENKIDLIKKDESRNVAGPPVYYPPGHQQLFDESMHTMTLQKESKRRGMAKWRHEEASGNKESGSSSDSKGGMAVVPVCLPLCCGAACTIM